MIKIFKYVIYSFLFVLYINVSAQVEVNGLVDFEVSQGGKDSNYGVNEISGDYKKPHLAVNQMNLFVFSQINEEFSVNMRLQFDTWATGTLNQLRLSLAELTWEPPEGSIRVSVGRFVNPFGLYPQRQLSIQNTFVNTPLAYGYAINITDQHGFYNSTGSGYTYGYGGSASKLTTISYAGYTTGALFSWLIIPELLNLDLAVTNVALTSQKQYTMLHNAAGIFRMTFQPLIYWQQGISFSHGSFMESAADNYDYGNLQQFTQTVAGTDWVIAYTYFELSGEFIYTFWKVPGYDTDGFKVDVNGDLGVFDLENYSYYVDLKYELPFLPGSYVAARYEEMKFKKYIHPATIEEMAVNPWDEDIRRYTVGIGYKFSPNIQLKIAYSDQRLPNAYTTTSSNVFYSSNSSNYSGPKAYTLRSILSAAF